jgi:AGCS family alanine or glycine:cation symporter
VLNDWVSQINDVLWGVPMIVAILGTGLYLNIRLMFMPIRRIGTGFKLLFSRDENNAEGDIAPFSALMTSLSATIGTGNIAGVATAVFLGGPGAIFWMWCTALVGMATKYAEAVLAVQYREVDEHGNYSGGPMYYIRNGLGPKWKWLAFAFAFFASICGFGLANTVQSNSVAQTLQDKFEIDPLVSGLVMMVLVGMVILGGIKRIAHVVSALVPLMGICYLFVGVLVLSLNASEVPAAVATIVESAFNPVAAQGGFAGAAVWAAMRWGVARGIFSNEAGLGSAPIAHAAARTNSPVRQGLIAMLGTFIDTIVVCSVTGLAIVVTGVWTSGKTGAVLTSAAFEQALPGWGSYVVTIGLPIFAFTTMLGWAYYGERATEYWLGVRAILPFRLLWVLAIPIGATSDLQLVWLVSDTLNALMALPNLIALLLLSPVVFRLTREYFNNVENR